MVLETAMAMPNPPQSASLYVGDLDPTVTENDLICHFSGVASVLSVRVCRDAKSQSSLRYAYVNFYSRSDASKVMELSNHTHLKGKPIRIMWSRRDPLPRKTGLGNLFIKNLDLKVDSAELHKIFAKFGSILSCKVMEENGQSKGFGFVQFDSEEAAQSAVQALHGSSLHDKKIHVSKFLKKSERQAGSKEATFTNVYVNNLDHGFTDVLLQEKFCVFGKIKSAIIMKDSLGKSKGFGFVCFESSEDAKKSVEAMNGAQIGSNNIYVGRAQKKEERQSMLRQQFEEKRRKQMQKFEGSNVYVKNLDDSIDDDKLWKHFSSCGKVSSAKVMRDDKGLSRGFGFVCFYTPDDANKAVNTLSGTLFYDRPLYVAIAEHKDHKSKLQHHFPGNIVPWPICSSSGAVSPSHHLPNFHSPQMSSATQFDPSQFMYQFYGADQNGIFPSSQLGYQTTLSSKVPTKQKQASDLVKELSILHPQYTPIFPYAQNQPVLPINALQGIGQQQPVKYISGNQYREISWTGPEYHNVHSDKKAMNKTASSARPSLQRCGIALEKKKG